MRNTSLSTIKAVIALYFLSAVFTFSFAQEPPEQPRRGPGGSDYIHQATKVTQYGTDITNWYWIIEPTNPKPDSAEVIVFFHGTNSNPDSTKLLNGQELFCRHIAQKGYTVIYPLYQYGGQTLPFTPQLQNAGEVIKLAFERLDNDPDHAPIKRWPNGKIKWGVTGISRGGGMSLNTASHHVLLGLPIVDAVVAFVPGSGRRHRMIHPDTKVVIVSAEEDETNGPLAPNNAHQEAWDSLWRHPCVNKEYFIVHSDYHGMPNIVAKHDCHGSGNDPNNRFRLNALDFFGSWKWSVGTFNCMFRNTDCNYVFGKDSISIFMGRWSDDTLVNPAAWVDPCTTVSTDPISSFDLSVYPNPASDQLFIEGFEEVEAAEIINIQGQSIQIVDIDNPLLHNIPPGMYFLKATMQTGGHICIPWVKN